MGAKKLTRYLAAPAAHLVLRAPRGVLVACSPTAQKPLSHAEKNGTEKEHNKKGQKFESLIQNCLLKTQRIRTRFHP